MTNLLRQCLSIITIATLGCVGGCVSSTAPAQSTAIEPTTAARLEADVQTLVSGFPGRSAWDRATLNNAGMWVAARFEAMGYPVTLEPVPNADGSSGFNVIATLPGTAHPDEIVVIGAHYDAEVTTPGADDNASGVAGMLELARRFAAKPQAKTIRWIGYTNEESSSSRGAKMGSRVSADNSKARGENIVAMISIEMIGYFSDEPNSQRYPFPPEMAAMLGMELPTVADYIAVVGRLADRALIDQIGSAMIEADSIPVVPVALPAKVPALYRSDHANYWFNGYPAVMLTDTSEYRFPHYHKPTDTPEVLDFNRMAGVVDGLERAVEALGNN